MNPTLIVILSAIVLVGLAIAGIAIKMFLKKGAEFKKQCSSIDPDTGERFGCTCRKAETGEVCDNK